ncbi:MAG: hypothetical protein ACQETL_08050 [Bacteroidota bacterium]
MVEVFKTNVKDQKQADLLIQKIRQVFSHYKANFDLEDCDNILRVETDDLVDDEGVIRLLASTGFKSEILQDIILSED